MIIFHVEDMESYLLCTSFGLPGKGILHRRSIVQFDAKARTQLVTAATEFIYQNCINELLSCHPCGDCTFSNEIHLLCGNHVVNARDGVKHSSHLVVMELLFVDFGHGYVEDASNAAIKKHFNNFSSDQVSTPHRSRFIGMARKKRYLL